MACTKCNEPITHICDQTPCVETQPCDCPIPNLQTKCLVYEGSDLVCSGIKKGTILTELIKQLDAYICKVKTDLINSFQLVNVGLGAKVFKGIDLLGRKEIRTIKTDDTLVVVTENTNDIGIRLNPTTLTSFVNNLIPAPQTIPNVTADNIGTGSGLIFRDKVGAVFNFRKIKTANIGTGASILKTEATVSDDVVISAKSLILSNVGVIGEEILKPITNGADDITISAKKIASKGSMIVETSVDGNTIYIDTPTTANIAGLFVNNDYAPTYNEWLAENKAKNGGTAISGFLFRGLGTMAQPFTDTRLYTLGSPLTAPTITANSSIANALIAFLGGNSRTNPLLSGQKIRVQKSTIGYTYSGDFSYSNLYLVLETDVVCTTTDWLVDMDNASCFNALNSTYTIELADNVALIANSSPGFRNSGNTDSTLPLFSTGRTGYHLGNGRTYTNYNGVNVLTQYVFNGNGNINNGNLHFQVKCQVVADYQGIYFTQNTQRIDFYNIATSGIFLGSVNLALKAFHMTGGQVRFYEKGAVKLLGETSGRTYGFTFLPTGAGIGNTVFALNSAKVSGNMQYCFAKLNNELVQFSAFNSPSGEGFTTVNPGTSTVIIGLFENLGGTRWSLSFKNNVFSNTGIDPAKVDLTQGNNVSTSNFIGNNIIESLVTRTGRTSGTQPATDLPVGSVFLNTNNGGASSTWIRDIVI